MQVLRTVLVQGFHLDIDAQGREVIRRRVAGLESGVPPAHLKVSSPYDRDARWGAKGPDLLWLGYKLHVTETCDDPPACGCPPGPAARPRRCPHDTLPNLVTHVATTDATVTDYEMAVPVTAALAAKGLPPARHYLDSGYASPQNMITAAREHQVTLVTPLLASQSRQAREGNGYSRQDFAIDFAARTATCPQGRTTSKWTPVSDRGRPAIHIAFRQSDCQACPARPDCTTSARRGRQLTIPARDLYLTQAAARAGQDEKDWQADYKRRAGIEATISQAVTVTGTRHARYRGLPKTRLQHAYTAVAINLWRLDAYWNDTPIDRTRTSHLTRLGLAALTSELTTSITASMRSCRGRCRTPPASLDAAVVPTSARDGVDGSLHGSRQLTPDLAGCMWLR